MHLPRFALPLSLSLSFALALLLTSPTLTHAFPVATPQLPHSNTLLSGDDGAVRFDLHRVVRVHVKTAKELSLLTKNERLLQFDYFTHHKGIGGHADIRIPPAHFQEFVALKLNYTILIDNLQKILDLERQEDELFQEGWRVLQANLDVATNSLGNIGNEGAADVQGIATAAVETAEAALDKNWFKGYHLYRDHQVWLAKKIKRNSKIAKSFSAGKTFEGRDQAGIKIGSGPNHVVFHGLQHAREFISGAVVEYLIDQLLKGKDPRVKGYLKKYTFHVIPIMNPDGFVIAQTKDRMHRKNAQPHGRCIGTDTNRNWDFHWGEVGASKDPCAMDYMGPSAFSSPEARNIGHYLKSLAPNVVSYMDFHSYSQLWMTPYGYTGTPPETYASYLKPLAQGAAKAISAIYGKNFSAGDIYNIIYPSSGSSADYAFHTGVGAPFGIELRDKGKYGFSLPANQIYASGKETWAAFTYVLDHLKTEENKSKAG